MEEEIKRKKSGKKNKKTMKVEKELLYIVGFVIFLVLVFIFSFSVFNKASKFNYEGLTFSKEKFGEIPVFRTSYIFRSPTGNAINYNMYLRNDPRTNDIPIEGKISYVGPAVYVTLETDYLRQCEDTSIAIPDLSRFLAENGLKVYSGNMDFTEAAIYNQRHITCEILPEGNVIQIRRATEADGDETRIVVSGRCNDIIIGDDCRILEATEKYKLQSYLDAQKR